MGICKISRQKPAHECQEQRQCDIAYMKIQQHRLDVAVSACVCVRICSHGCDNNQKNQSQSKLFEMALLTCKMQSLLTSSTGSRKTGGASPEVQQSPAMHNGHM
jgi:hypothetical protein